MKQHIKDFLTSTQPFRFVGKSVRNIFFPYVLQRVEPSELFVELTSICNAECVFCNYRFGHRAKQKIPLEKFENIIKSAYDMGYRRLNLTSMGGELFVHDKAIEAIETARDIGYEIIETYTNGILLNKLDIKRLLHSGITALKISFPGFDRQIYKDVYGVDRFMDFDLSLKSLLREHKELDSEVKVVLEPRSSLSMKELMDSEYYQANIASYIKDIVYMNKPIVRYDTWGGEISSDMLPSGMKTEINPLKRLLPNSKVHLCNMMQNFGVLANGDIRICNCRYDASIEKDDSLYIDNVFKYDSLRSAIAANKEKISRIRREFMDGKLPKLCQNCTFYLPIKILDEESL